MVYAGRKPMTRAAFVAVRDAEVAEVAEEARRRVRRLRGPGGRDHRLGERVEEGQRASAPRA